MVTPSHARPRGQTGGRQAANRRIRSVWFVCVCGCHAWLVLVPCKGKDATAIVLPWDRGGVPAWLPSWSLPNANAQAASKKELSHSRYFHCPSLVLVP
jgi:hypothetical protein